MLSPALLLCLAAPTGLGDAEPPVARIDFPLGSALTDAAQLRVRGTAHDPSGVAAVRVNGVPATSVDGFATWAVVVPLELGENALVVEAVDSLGNLDPAAASTVVRRDGVIMRRPEGLALDPASDTCFVFDWVPDGIHLPPRTRILAVDLVSGEATVVSSRSKGSGPVPRYATGEMEYDPLAKRLLLVDVPFDQLIAVDVATGDRSVLSGGGVGSGPEMTGAIGLELDPPNQRAWVVARSFGPTSGAVLEVDLTSGVRWVVSGPGVGSGPWPEDQTWATRAQDGDRLLIPCFVEDLVLGVDLSTGDRSIVSDASKGLGTPWFNVWDMAALPDGRAWVGGVSDGRLFGLDTASGTHAEVAGPAAGEQRELYDVELDLAHGRLLAADDLRSAILTMDVGGDALEVLVRNSIGSGAPFRRPLVRGTAVDRGGRAWMTDPENAELVAVELATGARTLVSGGGAGSGPAFVQPTRAGVDTSAGALRLVVMDTGLQAVVGVDPQSGARTILSGAGVGSGPPFNLPSWSGVSMDVAGGAAWVIDGISIFNPESRVMRVDLATGARTIVSGDGLGGGPTLVDCTGMAVDLAGGRALTFSFDELLAVDLATGDRSVLSSDVVGAGPSYGDPVLLEWDAVEQRALVYGRLAGVTAVDGTTGDRELLARSDETKGSGLAWPLSMDLWRPTPDAAPLLLVGDHELTALEVVDLARDPISGEVPAARAIVTR